MISSPQNTILKNAKKNQSKSDNGSRSNDQ